MRLNKLQSHLNTRGKSERKFQFFHSCETVVVSCYFVIRWYVIPPLGGRFVQYAKCSGGATHNRRRGVRCEHKSWNPVNIHRQIVSVYVGVMMSVCLSVQQVRKLCRCSGRCEGRGRKWLSQYKTYSSVTSRKWREQTGVSC